MKAIMAERKLLYEPYSIHNYLLFKSIFQLWYIKMFIHIIDDQEKGYTNWYTNSQKIKM